MEIKGSDKLNNGITFGQLLYGQTFIVVSTKKSTYVEVYIKCMDFNGIRDNVYGVNIETGRTHYFSSDTAVKPIIATLNIHGISERCLVSHDDNVSYRYLLSYTFIKKRPDHPMINDIGNGRLILDYKKKIETNEDIIQIENILMDKVEEDNLLSVTLNAFSLMSIESNNMK